MSVESPWAASCNILIGSFFLLATGVYIRKKGIKAEPNLFFSGYLISTGVWMILKAHIILFPNVLSLNEEIKITGTAFATALTCLFLTSRSLYSPLRNKDRIFITTSLMFVITPLWWTNKNLTYSPPWSLLIFIAYITTIAALSYHSLYHLYKMVENGVLKSKILFFTIGVVCVFTSVTLIMAAYSLLPSAGFLMTATVFLSSIPMLSSFKKNNKKKDNSQKDHPP